MWLSVSQWVNLVSAILGTAGAASLYKGSFGYEMFTPYLDQQMIDDMKARNQGRQWFQRTGLVLIFASFFLQGVAQFVP